MKSQLAASALTLGLITGTAACSPESQPPLEKGVGAYAEVPPEVTALHTEMLTELECNVQPANILIQDLAAQSLEAFGDSEIGKAVTTTEGIVLDDNLSLKEMSSYIIHETFHWCADRPNIRTYSQPLELPGIGMLTNSDGFIPLVNGDMASGNTHVEEAVVEWLSKETGDYPVTAPEYAISSELTAVIAKMQHIGTSEVIELLKQDDLLGLVGLMKNKAPQEVTGQDVNDIVYMYMNAYEAGAVPNQADLRSILK